MLRVCFCLFCLLPIAAWAAPPAGGWWWNPAEPGRGYSLEVSARDGSIFFAAYMYDASGDPVWYTATLTNNGNSLYQGDLTFLQGGQTLSGNYQPPAATNRIGAVTLSVSSPTGANLSMTGPGLAPTSIPIQRYAFVNGGLNSPPDASLPQTGWWWNPNEGGRGVFLEIQGGTLFTAFFMYDASGKPVWYVSQGAMASQSYRGQWAKYGGGQSLGGPPHAAAVTNANVGAAAIDFVSPSYGVMTLPNGNQIPLTRFLFGGPPTNARRIAGLRLVGAPTLVFDHLRDAHDPSSPPDGQVSAWKSADGTVNLNAPETEPYRMRGPDLAHLQSDRNQIYSSMRQANEIPENHDNYNNWFVAPYTLDGTTVYALTHMEWYACLLNNDCNGGSGVATATDAGDNQTNSWVTTLTEFVSRDGGASWAPNGVNGAHVVADPGYYWTGTAALSNRIYRTGLNHSGLMAHSRVIHDGNYFYLLGSLIHRDFTKIDPTTSVAPIDQYGQVILRTSDITRPAGWQAWTGGANFAPVVNGIYATFLPQSNGSNLNPANPQIVYDTAAQTYIMMFTTFDRGPIYYATSPSLANPAWSDAVPIANSAAFQTDPRAQVQACNTGFVDGNYVSLLDGNSQGLNFEFTNGAPWLFYISNPGYCGGDNLARDIYRAQLIIDYE